MIQNIEEENNLGTKKINKIATISALGLSILPILSPYSFIGQISINSILQLILITVIIVKNRKINFERRLSLVSLWSIHLILSLLSTYTTKIDNSLINSSIIISFNILCIIILWSNTDFDTFVKHANVLGVICCIFIFVQAFFLTIGLTPPSGRLFNLKLLDYATFVSTTWGFRLNSIFQEPSYFAIYTLPLLAVNLRKNKFILSLLYLLALALSTSSLGIIGAIIILVNHMIFEKKNIKQFVLISFTLFLIHIVSFNSIPFYNSSFNRSIDKILLIPQHSQIRFIGEIKLFNYLPFINQIIGIGINQMKNYFSRSYSDISNYSNSFVITLITTGIIGFTNYIIFIIRMFFSSIKSKRLIFMLIFLMVASTDYLIYNYFFFYLLTFINLK